MSGFDPVITALLSADNAQRNAAEQYYNQCVASDANAAMMELFRVLCTSATDGARQLAAVLLRSLFKPGADSTFAKLSIEMVTGAKHTVLQSLASETNRSVRTKIVHVVAVLAARTCGAPAHAAAPAAAWPELMPFVLQMVATPDAAQRTCAFTLLGQLSDFAGSLLLSDVPSVSRTFVAGLADAALPVRVAALISTCDFLIAQCMQDGDAVDASSCPTEQMLAVVGAALSAGEESLASDAMQALVSLAEFGAALLANGIGAIGAAMLSVASTASLEAATRKLGLELIVALSEALPARVRKSPPFVAAIVEMTIKLMCEVEDGDWNAEVHSAMATEDEDQDSAWIVAAESLYRLADALGKPVLGPAFAKLEALLGSARWQERWCGIRALDTLTEAQPKAMNRQLRTIVTAALRLCADPHQRVRYEALTCLARLPEHFPGKFQKVYGTTVLPVLINAIGDPATSGNRPRVRGCAVASVVQFCNPESCPSAIVKPSADALMGALATLLGGASTVAVQEEGLSAVAAMSGVLEEDFARYYTSFFPSILAILAAPAVAGRLVLRARAMQCVGIIASTVGAERFGPDATRVMETLMRTMAGGMAAEDPGVGMLLEACTRIASCIGAAFLPYMETVLTPILAMAAADVGFKVTDVDEGPLGQGGAEEADTASGFSSVVLDVRGMGKKQLTMNTFVIEQKVLACNMILEFAKSLEKDFVGFVERTATVVLPLVKFKYFEGVRSAAAFPLPKLLDSIVKSARASTAPAERAQMLAFGKGFLSACVASLQEQLQQEKAWECRACLVEAMKELFEVCFRSGGGERDRELAPIITLDVAASTTVVQFLCELGKQSYTRQLEMIGKVRNHPDYDEEMEEDLDESLGLEAELMSEVVDALGCVVHHRHHTTFLPLILSRRTQDAPSTHSSL